MQTLPAALFPPRNISSSVVGFTSESESVAPEKHLRTGCVGDAFGRRVSSKSCSPSSSSSGRGPIRRSRTAPDRSTRHREYRRERVVATERQQQHPTRSSGRSLSQRFRTIAAAWDLCPVGKKISAINSFMPCRSGNRRVPILGLLYRLVSRPTRISQVATNCGVNSTVPGRTQATAARIAFNCNYGWVHCLRVSVNKAKKQRGNVVSISRIGTPRQNGQTNVSCRRSTRDLTIYLQASSLH